MVISGLFLEDFEKNNLILIHVIYWNFKKYEFFKISSNPFHVAKTNQNKKKTALPSTVCHGLPENAFQVNQLYNVTWSSIHRSITTRFQESLGHEFFNISAKLCIKGISGQVQTSLSFHVSRLQTNFGR